MIGGVLGLAKEEGNEMDQLVIKANGEILLRIKLRSLQVIELHLLTEVKTR